MLVGKKSLLILVCEDKDVVFIRDFHPSTEKEYERNKHTQSPSFLCLLIYEKKR